MAVIADLLIAMLATRPSAASRQADSPLLGRPAPPIVGQSVTGARFSSLSALQGRWVFVNFFATWCVLCRQEHPEFIRFNKRDQADADVSIVMVIYSDKVAEVQDFFHTKGGDWPAVADPAGRVALDYGVSGVPETYLVDPVGVVVAKIVGGVTADALDRLLATKAR